MVSVGYAWQHSVASEVTVSANAEVTEPAAETAPEESIAKTGTFKGVGEKTGAGSASLVKKSDGSYTVRFEEDFKVIYCEESSIVFSTATLT